LVHSWPGAIHDNESWLARGERNGSQSGYAEAQSKEENVKIVEKVITKHK
jgi:hypothetical protein